MLKWLAPGKALLDYGPMNMVIEAHRDGHPLAEAVKAGGATAINQLREISRHLEVVKRPAVELEISSDYPAALVYMIEAARATGEPDATPMAAVAGSIAREVLNTLVQYGATRAVVNNGGDIALHIESGRPMRVGVITNLAQGMVTHYLDVEAGQGIGGIATSGMGGRSFTKGVASAVVALAENAPLADACATLLANAVNVDHPDVFRVRAELLDPATDIPGHLVTLQVGELDDAAAQRALEAGRAKFNRYYGGQLLTGVILAVQGRLWMYPPGLARKIDM